MTQTFHGLVTLLFMGNVTHKFQNGGVVSRFPKMNIFLSILYQIMTCTGHCTITKAKIEGLYPFVQEIILHLSSSMTRTGGKCALKPAQLDLFPLVIWSLSIQER